MILNIQGLTFRYQKSLPPVLENFSLEMAAKETLALVGPSGCGKSTLLRLIAGLEEVEAGTIEIAGRTVSSPTIFVEPDERDVGMVFQDYALFPHMTVLNNIAYGLRGMRRREKRKRALEMLELVKLRSEASKYPHELSGGQQQRIALARSLCPKPSLLLLDEPFSNLDAALKSKIRGEVRGILRHYQIATILVTHDLEDARYLADRSIEL